MKKIIKKVFLSILILIVSLVVVVGGYCGYLVVSYERIGNVDLDVNQKALESSLKLNNKYSAVTYNIGFSAYSQDYTFFLDTGYDIDGNETCGYWSTARSKEESLLNLNGSLKTVQELDLDFVLLQEVDINSTRSFNINQNQLFVDGLSMYDNIFCCNYNTPFLPYPFYDMHGKSYAGLSTFSRYQINDAYRVEYTISDTLTKMIDCDRCFSVSIVNVENGKKLYIVNSHMSAYDKGGTIREKQITELNEFLTKCKENEDYVIIGGDFNHDLITYNPVYDYSDENKAFNNILRNPDWVAPWFDEEGNSPLVDGYKVVAADNAPTCRNNDIGWNPDVTFKCVVDGFIVSDNVEITENYNVITKNGNLGIDGFAFSDHQPAYIEFELK